MHRYTVLFFFLICFSSAFAQQNEMPNSDSLLIKQIKGALKVQSQQKRELKINEILENSFKNGGLFTFLNYNFLIDANLKEKWLLMCGKVVDKLLDEQGLSYAIQFINDLHSEKIPLIDLERNLILKIQQFPNDTSHLEILIQIYVLEQQFEKAWLQLKALDLRLKKGGLQLAEYGQLLFQQQNWEFANRVFDYIIKIYPSSSKIYLWKQYSLLIKEQFIFSNPNYNAVEVRSLITAYRQYRKDSKLTALSQETLLKEAKLFAYQLNNLDSAVIILQNAVNNVSDETLQAHIKMDLSDYLSFQGKKYDALILLAQAEKLVKDSPLSYEAKLKKAKLYYFTGDFELAKELLDILKESSQREISNDALNLRWVIEDNTGIDSLESNLKDFSTVQWFYEQNKISKADSALMKFSQKVKNSSLEDDVLFLQANRFLTMNKMEESKNLFLEVYQRFPNDIYADDALYQYLKLTHFLDKNLCQKFIENYPTSLFLNEIRGQLLNQ